MAISSLRVSAALRPAPVPLKAARDVVDALTWSALPWLPRPLLPVTLSIFARRNKAASFTHKENTYMEPFTKLTGLVAPLDRTNVNTDEITPARFLKTIKRTGFGEVLFANWRYFDGTTNKPNPDFVLNQPRYQGVSILLAGGNFGRCPSRQPPSWAIADLGFACLIAPSFADFFYNNCFNNRILPVTFDETTLRGLFKAHEAT